MKFGVFLILVLLFSSCVDLKKPEQLNSMDVLSLQLSGAHNLKLELSDSIQLYLEQTTQLDSLLKHTYNNDTLRFYDAQNIDSFIILKGEFPALSSALSQIDSAIALKKNSVECLRRDIEQGKGNRSKHSGFITFEEGEVLRINEQLKEKQLRLIQSMETFNALYPKLNDYLSSLKNDV